MSANNTSAMAEQAADRNNPQSSLLDYPSPPSIALRLRGRVKWFDPVKGFGFIVADPGGQDILLHANVLRSFGQSSVSDGAEIEVTVQQTRRGLQAVAVVHIAPPATAAAATISELEALDDLEIENLALQPARVKWFDKAKGFGFANAFGSDADVFVHVEVLRRSGFADLQPGEAISLAVIEGERGLMAVRAAPWESAWKEERQR